MRTGGFGDIDHDHAARWVNDRPRQHHVDGRRNNHINDVDGLDNDHINDDHINDDHINNDHINDDSPQWGLHRNVARCDDTVRLCVNARR